MSQQPPAERQNAAVTILEGILRDTWPNEAACPADIAKYVWDHLEALDDEREVRAMRRYLTVVPLVIDKIRQMVQQHDFNRVADLCGYWLGEAKGATDEPAALMHLWSHQSVAGQVAKGACDERACTKLEQIIDEHASIIEGILESLESGEAAPDPEAPIGLTSSS